MKGRLGKWLAVLLSVSMLAGTAPVYGADISMESDFSSGAAETEEQPDVQEGTEITEEPGDSDVEITEEPETEQPEDAEFSKGEFNGEDQEELVMDGSDDEDSAELTFEDAPFAGENSTKEYLKDLSVYSGYGVKDPLEISRREDLDETYGGKTYTVEIGSSYNSTGFYVTADLGADAPEGSTIRLSACDLDGKTVESEIIATGYTDGKRYNFSNVFTKDNGKRAVYTVTAGTATDSQTYKIVVLRRLDLSMIGCYLPRTRTWPKT